MTKTSEKQARNQRFAEAVTLHEIEANPLSVGDKAMFEMFEREGWSHERRRAYIMAQVKQRFFPDLAAE